eukprot:scaffold58734_cov65-Phaeocystis_antarctica.AAC.1
MIHWATNGLTRVEHVLNQTETATLTFSQLRTAVPRLVTQRYTEARAREQYAKICSNLQRWVATLRVPTTTPVLIADEEFRWTHDGRILRALREARPRDLTVPAALYEQQPYTSLIAPTGEEHRLSTRPGATTPCHVACLTQEDDNEPRTTPNTSRDGDTQRR